MTGPSEMTPERRQVLLKVAPLLESPVWEAVLRNVTDLLLNEIAASRDEGRREERERLKAKIDNRLNNHLVEMRPDWDDSIVGFNDAWDIVRAIFAELPQ